MKEIKSLKGYFATADGQIWYGENKVCKRQITKRQYPVIRISRTKKRVEYFVHRLVAEAFIPNPENKPCINHINGNKYDNRATNLEWCTIAENNAHMHKYGLWKKSEKKSGIKYLYWEKGINRWKYRIGTKTYGSYKTLDEAKKKVECLVRKNQLCLISEEQKNQAGE